MAQNENQVSEMDELLDGLSSSQVAFKLYGLIDGVDGEKFTEMMNFVAESIFHDKREGKDPRWDLNYILNEWSNADNLRRSLLFQATFHNNVQIVQVLLDHGVCQTTTIYILFRAIFFFLLIFAVFAIVARSTFVFCIFNF